MQGQNVGSIYGTFELDNRGFKAELKKTERETNNLIAALNKSGKVKVDTAQWKKLTSEMGTLNKKAHETQMALLKAPAGTPEAKKLSSELKNLEARIRMIKKVTDPTTKAIKNMARANTQAKASATGAAAAPGGLQQFGGTIASQAASRLGPIGGAVSMLTKANPYVIAATALVAALTGVSVIAKKVTHSILELTNQTAAWAQDTRYLSASIGVSVGTLQRFKHAADTMNFSYEGVTRGIGLLIKKMPEIAAGSGPAAQAFARLGISATDSSGQLREMDDLVMEVIAKLQQIPNTAARGAMAAELFGRGWMELAPILSMSADEFRETMAAADSLGVVLSDTEMAALHQYQGSLDDLSQALKGAKIQVAAAFGPYLQQAIKPIVDDLPRAITAIKKWLESLKPSLSAMADAFKKAWVAFQPMAKLLAQDFANAIKVSAWMFSKIANMLPRIVSFLNMCYRSGLSWLSVLRRIYEVLARILHLPPIEIPAPEQPPAINPIDVDTTSETLDRQAQLAADAKSEVASLQRQIDLAGDSSTAAAMSWEILNGKYRDASDVTKKLLMDTAKLKDAADARVEMNKKLSVTFAELVGKAKSFFNVIKQRAGESVRVMEQFVDATIEQVKRQADVEKQIRDKAASDAKSHYEKLSELGRAGAIARTGVSMFKKQDTEVPISYSADKVSAAAAAVMAGRAAEAKVKSSIEGQLYGGAIARQRAIAGAAEPPWEEIKNYLSNNLTLTGQLANLALSIPLILFEVKKATRPVVESGI